MAAVRGISAAVAVLCLVVLAPGPVVAVDATNSDAHPVIEIEPAPDHDGRLNVTATVSRAGPDRLRVRLTFADSTVNGFGIYPASPWTNGWSNEFITVETSDDFRRDPDGFYQWRGDGTPPEFVYTVHEDVYERVDVNESWAFGHDYALLPSFAYNGEKRQRLVAENGYGTSEYVLLGEYTTAKTSGRDNHLTAVVSTAISDDIDAGRAVETLAEVTRSFDVGGDPANTTMFVVPASYSGPFGIGGDRNLLIRGDAVWDGLMTHEYLHTRQEFETAADMQWFLEGSAFYYMALVPYNRGTMDWDEFERRVAPVGHTVALTETTSYSDARLRGPRVLGALDRRIREATNNTRTLEDVYRRLNEHEQLTYEQFRADVTAIAGPDLGPWLDAHVDGSENVTAPEPGQFVPRGWQPSLGERLLVCRDGEWVPAADAGPLTADEPVDIVYTGPGLVTNRGDPRFAERRAGACSRDTLGRIAGPGANDVVTVVPQSSLTFVADTYYRAENQTLTVQVERTPTPTETASPTETPTPTPTEEGISSPTATPTPARTDTPTRTTGSGGDGFGVVAALIGVGGTLALLGYRRTRDQ